MQCSTQVSRDKGKENSCGFQEGHFLGAAIPGGDAGPSSPLFCIIRLIFEMFFGNDRTKHGRQEGLAIFAQRQRARLSLIVPRGS